MTTQELIQLLYQNKDEERAKWMSAYLRNQFDFLGIQTPKRRALSKDFLLEKKKEKMIDWDFVNELWKEEAREFQLVATDYLQLMRLYHHVSDLEQYCQFITCKSWWDSVDSMVKNVGYIVSNNNEGQNMMLNWSGDNNIWIRRVAILHQLGFKVDTNKDILATIIHNNFASQEFFINKAIGWALRDYARTNPEWVMEFVNQHRDELHSLSQREAMKHLSNMEKLK